MELAYFAVATIGSTIVFKAVIDLFHSHITGEPYLVRLPAIVHTHTADKMVGI